MKRALGVCYYPEQWPQKMWAADAQNMRQAGIAWVRIGEFSWSKIEPTPDALTWNWLDKAIDVLGSAGLDIVLGTPSATPPRWMADKYPDLYAFDAQGRPRGFGSRRHYCFSHAGYRKQAQRITQLFSQRYAANSYIKAWQVDNEYDCHDTALSYSPSARSAFQNWCAVRYKSIKALNAAWGNVFWSMEYNDFTQIDLPNLTVTQANPAHMLAFRRFSSDQVVRFNRSLCDAIRTYSQKPIIHNFMGRITGFDHFAVGADLDISAWDAYPLGFLLDRVGANENDKQRYLRQGDPDFQAFHHDLYRATSHGRMWVMELQPGPVNWAPWNPAPLCKAPRLWAWEAFAHGAETVCYFRWRQAPFAQEQLHSGLRRPDDTPAPALADAAQVAAELETLEQDSIARAKVAIVFDYDSAFAWESLPQGQDFDYFQLVFDLYRALRRKGLSLDIVPKTVDPAAYKLIFAPALLTVPASLTRSCGAIVVLGPRAGHQDEEFSIPLTQCPNIPPLQTHTEYVESLPPFAPIPLRGGGAFHKWREALRSNDAVCYQLTDGSPAVVRRDHVYYIGGWPDMALWHRIIEGIAKDIDLPLTDMPPDLRQRETGKYKFFFNYGPDTVQWQGRTIPAAGVLWEKRCKT